MNQAATPTGAADVIAKHRKNLRALANRLNVEYEVPLDVAQAMLASASQIVKLLGLMKQVGQSHEACMVQCMTFTMGWELLRDELEQPRERLLTVATTALEWMAESKKAFHEDFEPFAKK